MQAATAIFVAKGYDGTSMDEIATKASVSKQTIYKHFSDKDHLFTEIVLATTQQVDHVVGLVAHSLDDTQDLARDLERLARAFLDVLMDEELLQVRRLVISNAGRMPSLGRDWYEQGFGRVLAMLASCFRKTCGEKAIAGSKIPSSPPITSPGCCFGFPSTRPCSLEITGRAKRRSWTVSRQRPHAHSSPPTALANPDDNGGSEPVQLPR